MVGDEYEFLETYKGADTKIMCRHNTCYHEWSIRPSSFLRGVRCPICVFKVISKRMTKTNKEFLKEVYDLVGNEYVFLEEYVGSQTKILCKHNIKECGYEWYVKPNHILKGNKCPQCSRPNYNRDTNQFKQEVYDLVGDEYVVLGEYIDAKTKILMKHNKCGDEWKTVPDGFLRGTRCPQCRIKAKTKSNDDFVREVKNLVGNEYVFLEEYKNSMTKIKCKHNTCGHEWDIKPNTFLQGKGCPECYGNKLKTNEKFVQEVVDLVGNEYEFLEKYINNATKIKCRHNNCGHEWNVTPISFLTSPRCPKCAESKGEQRIRKYLEKQNIKLFKQEYSFDGLFGVNGGLLRFDFAIFNETNNIKLLIEYDGEYHFKKYYEEQNFEELQIHDQRKNQYCKENNIPLLRIPYWEFDNIEDILFRKLAELEVSVA